MWVEFVVGSPWFSFLHKNLSIRIDRTPGRKPAKAHEASFIDIVNYFYFIYFRTEKKLNDLSLENCNVSLEKRCLHS